nr:hypothetical protein [uncultured Mediterranean phage uvMED]
MITFVYSEKSCTLYKHYKYKNTGSDEILELENDFATNGQRLLSRILIKFDLSNLKPNVIDDVRYFLNLKVTQKTELENNSKIEIFPIKGDWEEGKGRFADHEIDYSGASWGYRDSNLNEWNASTSNIQIDGGGAWYSKVTDSTETEFGLDTSGWFRNEFSDMRVDVTQIVNYWLYSGLENQGFLIKYANEGGTRAGNVKFFSRSTNTVYYPYLEMCKNDFKFEPCEITPTYTTNEISLESGSLDSGSLDSGSLDSGSLDSGSLDSGSLDFYETTQTEQNTKSNNDLQKLESDDIIPKIKRIKKQYAIKAKEKIKIGVRERFPQKKFSNRSRYNLEYYTTNNIFYSIRDAETEEIIIDFSEFTQVSCDCYGHYFKFDFSCLSIGRYYKFLLKNESSDSSEILIDERTFKVVY